MMYNGNGAKQYVGLYIMFFDSVTENRVNWIVNMGVDNNYCDPGLGS